MASNCSTALLLRLSQKTWNVCRPSPTFCRWCLLSHTCFVSVACGLMEHVAPLLFVDLVGCALACFSWLHAVSGAGLEVGVFP